MRSPIDSEYSDAFTANDDRCLILGHALLSLLEDAAEDPIMWANNEFP